jgi:hypothetical protein
MMGLRGDYFHTGRDLSLGKRLLNQMKLTTGKACGRKKSGGGNVSPMYATLCA